MRSIREWVTRICLCVFFFEVRLLRAQCDIIHFIRWLPCQGLQLSLLPGLWQSINSYCFVPMTASPKDHTGLAPTISSSSEKKESSTEFILTYGYTALCRGRINLALSSRNV